MPGLEFLILDVFARERFQGNQLAVFLDGRQVPERWMQRIARELNLSETTFLLPPEDPANVGRLRIFTPLEELPMAGHPTVGSAFCLAADGRITPPARIVFEEGVGAVPVEIEGAADGATGAVMEQPLPRFGPRFGDRAVYNGLAGAWIGYPETRRYVEKVLIDREIYSAIIGANYGLDPAAENNE